MYYINRYLFFILLFLFINNIFANTNNDLVQVEIIVFENLNRKNNISEILDSYSGLISHKHALDLATTDFILPEESLQFTEEALKIKKNRNYKLLLHMAWKHYISGENRKDPVYIAGLDLKGLVGIKSQQNMYQARADFKFKDFRLTRTAKLHQKELYYFDHPMFGLLLSVMPFDNG